MQQNALDQIANEAGLGVSFELPIFNQHQGAIGEAVGRRTAAGEHLKAVQAQIFAQIDRAELAWPASYEAWVQARSLAQIAEQQDTGRRRALDRGASDRSEMLAAQIASTEAHLAVLEAAYAAQLAFGALEDALPPSAAGRGGRVAGGRSARMRTLAALLSWALLIAAVAAPPSPPGSSSVPQASAAEATDAQERNEERARPTRAAADQEDERETRANRRAAGRARYGSRGAGARLQWRSG